MTRTGKSQRLMEHREQPFVDISPEDARLLSLQEGQLVEVSSPQGKVLVRVQIDTAQEPGEVFMPIHWTTEFASNGVLNRLLFSHTDPISGQPEFKQTAVNLKAFEHHWYGFLITRQAVNLEMVDYWSKVKGDGYFRYEMAGKVKPENWHEWVLARVEPWINTELKAEDLIRFKDPAQGNYRDAIIVNSQLQAVLFISSDKSSYAIPNHEWVSSLFKEEVKEESRLSLLSGIPAQPQEDVGKIICSCYRVGLKTIVNEIRDNEINTVDQLGEALECGTNCGSCVPELSKILSDCSKTQ